MHRLKIALIAHIRHPIAEPFMGGMEAHSFQLAKSLSAAGHEVTLFATGDSKAAGRLFPLLEQHYDRRYPWHEFHGTEVLNALLDEAFGKLLPELAGFDVVHNNSLHRYPPRLSRRDRIPMVTSLHIPPFDALRRAVHASAAPWCRFTVCSQQQRAIWWPGGAPPEAHVLYNGIDLERFAFRPRGNGRGIWAGRITPTKGTHIAVAAARRAGIGLSIYGTIEHRDYFETEVKPLLGGDIRYEGHLETGELAEAMAAASVLLFTPLWQEPFGLVAAEAMACGVPVASLDNGASREIVGPGGALATEDTAEALAAAIEVALTRERRDVRRWAVSRYGQSAMIDSCLRLYGQAMQGVDAPAAPVAFEPSMLPQRPEPQTVTAA
ncbi:glycosyltransferase [Sulfitobacter aestuarii]|uniref:Glycosyltransferase n=1 Tax=Sulfitobacter aestuarii TaxID=2161676 RepID=A0ABW5U433_9RHOB